MVAKKKVKIYREIVFRPVWIQISGRFIALNEKNPLSQLCGRPPKVSYLVSRVLVQL